MLIELPFGKSEFTVDVFEQRADIFAIKPTMPRPDAIQALSEHRVLKEFRGRDTLCVVNDATRPTKSGQIIRGCQLECDFIIATGAHACPTDEEIRRILGPDVAADRIQVHDAAHSQCVYLGETKRGTPVRFNRAVFDYKRILIIGSVEPHYFAGYTGGRKGLLPGLASYETIEKNHALYFEPGADILRLGGNPVHEDMVEAVQMLDLPILSINMVMGKRNEIVDLFCGEMSECLDEATALARSLYSVPVEKRYRLSITCADHPMDLDLYQSHKAIHNATFLTEVGGTIVLVSECRSGIGPRRFYDIMAMHSTPSSIRQYSHDHYTLGCHKAASFARALEKHHLRVVSDLPDSLLRKIHMAACAKADLQSVIDGVQEEGGDIAFMLNGSMTVPVSAESSENEGVR